MHEDGLADFFDGLGVRHDPRQRLEVMKDPHLGSYGALALFFVTGLQWACLWELPPQELAKALLLSQVGGRWVSLLLIARLPYLQQRDSRASAYLPRQGWSPGLLYGSLVFGVCFLWIGDLRTTLFGLGTAGILALGWIYTLKRDLGGYNGDCLGASIKTSELVFLLLANALWRV
jgi:adenosylcobinamide-GDP ribazoletransferase